MTRRKPSKGRRPRGRCGKAIYWNEIDAKIDLARWRARDGEEVRVRSCNICWGHVFHLTSEEQRSQPRERTPQSIDGESPRAIA